MIAVEDLRKHYKDVRAVDGITLTVAEGEVFGLLGHNGAGKTTTIRVLTGRALPTSGRASVAGHDVATARSRVRPLINVVFEEQNLYDRLSGRDNLRFFARLPLAFAVIVTWAVLAYVLVLWRLRRNTE